MKKKIAIAVLALVVLGVLTIPAAVAYKEGGEKELVQMVFCILAAVGLAAVLIWAINVITD